MQEVYQRSFSPEVVAVVTLWIFDSNLSPWHHQSLHLEDLPTSSSCLASSSLSALSILSVLHVFLIVTCLFTPRNNAALDIFLLPHSAGLWRLQRSVLRHGCSPDLGGCCWKTFLWGSQVQTTGFGGSWCHQCPMHARVFEEWGPSWHSMMQKF